MTRSLTSLFFTTVLSVVHTYVHLSSRRMCADTARRLWSGDRGASLVRKWDSFGAARRESMRWVMQGQLEGFQVPTESPPGSEPYRRSTAESPGRRLALASVGDNVGGRSGRRAREARRKLRHGSLSAPTLHQRHLASFLAPLPASPTSTSNRQHHSHSHRAPRPMPWASADQAIPRLDRVPPSASPTPNPLVADRCA